MPLFDSLKNTFLREKPNPFIFYDGQQEVEFDQLNHVKTKIAITINGKRRQINQSVQLWSGDCILANWLNTLAVLKSLENQNSVGDLLGEINGARALALQLRQTLITPPSSFDGEKPLQCLTNGDVINLYNSIFKGCTPIYNFDQTKNYYQFDRGQISPREFSQFVLEQSTNHLTFPSGIAVIGTKKHSHVIMACDEGFLSIDAAEHPPIDYQKYTTPGNLSEYQKAASVLIMMDPPQSMDYLTKRTQESTNFDVFFVAHSPNAKINIADSNQS